jgi:hypothetical protein
VFRTISGEPRSGISNAPAYSDQLQAIQRLSAEVQFGIGELVGWSLAFVANDFHRDGQARQTCL